LPTGTDIIVNKKVAVNKKLTLGNKKVKNRPCFVKISVTKGSLKMNNLKKKRTGLRIPQERLSELSGVPRSYISMIESGHKPLTLKQAELLAPHLHCNAFELMGSDVIKYEGSNLDDFVSTLKSLTTGYFDMDLLEDERIPAQIKLRYWICFDLANSSFSDDDLDMVYRLVEKLKEDKK